MFGVIHVKGVTYIYIWVCEKEVSKPNHSTDLQALPPPHPKNIHNYTFALNKSKLTAADTGLRVGKSILCMIALEVTCVRGERGGGWGGGGVNFRALTCKEVSNFWLSCSWEQCDSNCCFSICIWASKFFSLSWNQCNHHSHLEKYAVLYLSISRTYILLQIPIATTIPNDTLGIIRFTSDNKYIIIQSLLWGIPNSNWSAKLQ